MLAQRKRVDLSMGYMDLLSDRVSARRLLDVGVVEHDATHYDHVNWLHGRLCNLASECTGVDVLTDGVAALVERGFSVLEVDATSDVFIGSVFDVVHVGDVVEHVNDPVALLEFCERHLDADGVIIMKTPNPMWLRCVWGALWRGTYIANAEHVTWFTPSTALELGSRAGLELYEYWLIAGRSKQRGIWTRLVLWCLKVMRVQSDVFAPFVVYVYKRHSNEVA